MSWTRDSISGTTHIPNQQNHHARTVSLDEVHMSGGSQELHQDNMPMFFIPSYTPLLYSKIGVYRGIHNFLIFALNRLSN